MGFLVTLAELVEALSRGIFGCDFVSALPLLGFIYLLWSIIGLGHLIIDWAYGFGPAPAVMVEPGVFEKHRGGPLPGARKFDYAAEWSSWPKSKVPCWDPATMEFLGEAPAMGAAEVNAQIAKAKAAQALWAKSSFAQRRFLLRILQRFVTENAETIATVACRESGKTVVDAMVGELTVTLEKLRWTVASGEQHLLPEYRTSGLMNLHKTSRVEWVPVGVVGAIVPWNYPFHNVFNPLIAATFSGNAIIIKVSEFASWSASYFTRVIRACLEAAGAPPDLVQISTGYAEAGSALVAGADKIIFVGSVSVGKKVMEAASKTLTPVILELGGKDPFVVCDDMDIDEALTQLVVRGAFQNMGQNCAGPERFIVYERVYKEFCDKVTALVKQLKQGAPLGAEGDQVDCGACVHPPSLEGYQRYVDDAVAKGALVLCGGRKKKDGEGQFFEPTVLAGVKESMLIAQEETFGPILSIFKVAKNSDEEAVRLANACRFALSSCAHSKDQERAAKLCLQFEAGMASVNDVEGTTYLSQSLPFGGYKDSGFGRFAGPEGLRGLCHERSIVQNRAAFLKPTIPRAIAYPACGQGPAFCMGLNLLLYGHDLLARGRGLYMLATAGIAASKDQGSATEAVPPGKKGKKS